MTKPVRKPLKIVAISGGPDSVYLAEKFFEGKIVPGVKRCLLLHVNYGTRGKDSDADQFLVEELARRHGAPLIVRKLKPLRRAKVGPGFEEKARKARYGFFSEVQKKHGIRSVLIAHTADDQVETVLMRVLEGAGIAGLKGIPRKTEDGVERPLLDTWREDILTYLHERRIPYRIDRSNFDIRFERNWIRYVMIPILEKRYGPALRRRIFALGERFREIDDYLEAEAQRWIGRNVRGAAMHRKAYSKLPALLRVRILQRISYYGLEVSPNERLLKSMDKVIVSGGPSATMDLGKGASLSCRYDVVRIARRGKLPGKGEPRLLYKEGGKVTPAQARRISAKGDAEVFDAGALRLPLTIRPLRTGDRVRPFGLESEKKVKEILIDKKIPREDRWGRPVVCDAAGEILWIPGVIRSNHAPVAPRTLRTVRLRLTPA